MDGRVQTWTNGWGIVLVLEELSKAGSLNRAGQGGERGGDEATCSGYTGNYRLHRMVCLEIGNAFVSTCHLRVGGLTWEVT